MADWLHEWASEHGYRAAWADLSMLDGIHGDIEALADSGQISRSLNDEVFREIFAYSPSDENVNKLTTVILVSVPRPHHYLLFETENGPVKTRLPATYVNYRQVRLEVLDELKAALAKAYPGMEFTFEALQAPMKSLATRTGVATYGRNNITYDAHTGSQHQLVGFYTDVPAGRLAKTDPKAPFEDGSTECAGCDACIRACPTGAITPEKFVINAQRCLTHLNENTGQWPDWASEMPHNCLIGCLICQEVCPRNAEHFKFEEVPVSFNLEETHAILESADPAGNTKESRTGPVWDGIRKKLDVIGLVWYESVLGRNLEALLSH